MRTERPGGSPGETLKQAPGSILDLQFLVQAGLLICAGDHPEVAESSHWHEQLDALVQVGWLDQAEARQYRATYDQAQLQLLRIGMEMTAAPMEPAPELLAAIRARMPGLLEA